MAKWLFKTEPGDYSWDELVADKRTAWDGVRNYQAAINMRTMRKGDLAFFYRSLKSPAVIGTMRVVAEAYPDPADEKGKFVLVDVEPVDKLANEVSLKAIKAEPRLGEIALVRQSRLSVMPVTDEQWDVIMELADKG